jgi:hypothetical protein
MSFFKIKFLAGQFFCRRRRWYNDSKLLAEEYTSKEWKGPHFAKAQIIINSDLY